MMLLSRCADNKNPIAIPDASLPESTINGNVAQAPTEPSTDANKTLNSDLVSLLKQDNLKVSEDLITQFYKYYRINNFELSLLPAFNTPEQMDWDQFTHFIYRGFVHSNPEDVFTKENFAQTVNRYFGPIDYTDRDSLYLTYENGIYTRKPGDEPGGAYYRLTNISKDADGIYTAVFDGLFFGELEYSDLYEEASPNIRAIRDTAGTKEAMCECQPKRGPLC